jgi:uncharacterized membrane-anchored protein
MSYSKLALFLVLGFALAVFPLRAQQPGAKVKPTVLRGPATASLEGIAKVDVPAGFVFLDGKTTRAMMKASGEPTSGREYGALMPTNSG